MLAVSKINQLRIVKSINKAQFTTLKNNCRISFVASFNPPIRKTENLGILNTSL